MQYSRMDDIVRGRLPEGLIFHKPEQEICGLAAYIRVIHNPTAKRMVTIAITDEERENYDDRKIKSLLINRLSKAVGAITGPVVA